MPKLLRSFFLMLTFVTRIPFPIRFEIQDDDFVSGYKFFPIIGVLVGVIISIPLLLEDYIPSAMLPFLIILLYLLVVGGLHLDGVSDVFDGLFSARDRDEMLVIMEDSRIGAFGVVGLILYFLGIYIGLGQLMLIDVTFFGIDGRFWFLTLMPVVGRMMALISAGFSDYAKDRGLGKSLMDRFTSLVSYSLIVLLCVGGYFLDLKVAIACGATVIVAQWIIYRIHKILRGITGDVIGMIIEMSQIIFLFTLAIIYHI